MGRVNYGPRIGEPTGLIGPSSLDREELCDWDVTPLSFENLAEISKQARPDTDPFVCGPAFVTGRFDTPNLSADHFLDLSDFGKELAWINGFSLGRYWSRGLQKTLYVPAPILQASHNTIIVFKLHSCPARITFTAHPNLGPREP